MTNPRAMFDKSSQSPHDGGDDFWLHAKDRWLGSSFGDAAAPKSQQTAPALTAAKPEPLQRKFK